VPIIIATGNPGKLREFRQILGGSPDQWPALSDFGSIPPIEETGATFRENACLKAAGYARALKSFALADDSGLEVDALHGKPGVYSARWAEMNQSGRGDADNNALLLRQLADVPDDRRSGRFVCVLALSDPLGRIILTSADWIEGKITRDPAGENGFGYDPLFLVAALGKTTAQLSSDEKHAISHRGKALRRMRNLLSRANLP
jgi:XTP/dITP diphosphohydrolase